MMRRKGPTVLAVKCALGLAGLGLLGCRPAESATPGPHSQPRAGSTNVLMIVVTSLSRDRIGCYGCDIDTTPYIDDLAKYGYAFHWVATASPESQQAVSALLTGRYPGAGPLAHDQTNRVHSEPMPATLADSFSKRGYRTIAVSGSRAVDMQLGLERGFDTMVSASDMNPTSRVWGNQVRERFTELVRANPEESRPFFGVIIFSDCEDGPENGPISTPRDDTWNHLKSLFKKSYDQRVAYVDAQIRDLMFGLEDMGINDVLIVVTSDHGSLERDPTKRTTVTDYLLVPWVMYHPGLNPAWGRYYQLVQTLDVTPTILEVLDLPVDGRGVSGVSRAGLINGSRRRDPSPIAVSIAGDPRYETAVIFRDHLKFILSPGVIEPSESATMQTPTTRVYDYQRDPEDRVNLAADPATQSDVLIRGYEQWRRTQSALQVMPRVDGHKGETSAPTQEDNP